MMYHFNNRYGIDQFNIAIAIAAVAITAVHLSSPFLVDEYVYQGRFQSVWTRATLLGISYSPMVIAMFWMGMATKSAQLRIFFIAAGLVGFGLILWSGSRSPIAGTLMGIGILWLFFRSPILLAMGFIAVLGIAVQVIFGISGDIEANMLLDRFQDAESGRFELWAEYFKTAIASPIYGYSDSQFQYALLGEGSTGAFLSSIGVGLSLTSIHNAYLGLVLRFGFVGLILWLSMLVFALIRARQVMSSKLIPFEEKSNYLFPVAILPVVAFINMFEDFVPGTGKGTVTGLVFYASLVICQVYGSRLLNVYERVGENDLPIITAQGIKIIANQSGSV